MSTQRPNSFQLNRVSIISKVLLTLTGFLLSFQIHAANLSVVNLASNSTEEVIQTTLDTLPEGGEVVLATGTYEIHQPLFLRHDHQTLRGVGVETILHLADKANCPVVILGSPMTTPLQTVSHVRLADLTISGNRLNQQVEFWHSAMDGSQLNNNGIDVWAVNDSSVENVVCESCRSGGLVTAVTRRLDVKNFTAYDNQFDGLACYSTEECHFSGLHLHDNLAAGISLDLSFNNNVITDATLSGNDLGVFMRNSRNNSFRGLTISKSHDDGVFMAQTLDAMPDGWKLKPGTECSGNDFVGLTITNCGGDAFLVNDTSCVNNLIRGGQFNNNTRGSLKEASANLVRVEELVQR